MNHIHTQLMDFLKESLTQFSPLNNPDTLRYLANRKYSQEESGKHLREFKGKNGKRYYISQDIGKPIFQVYDADLLDKAVNSSKVANPNLRIARAIFNDTGETYITGFEHSISISVDDEHKRNGVASAIIDFAEERTGKKYRHSSVITKDMEEFVRSRKMNENVLFEDEHGKLITYDDGTYRIAVDDDTDAQYITLWYNTKDKWTKVGYLDAWKSKMSFKDREGTYLSIRSIEIDKKHQGKGFGRKLYQTLFKYKSGDVKGIYSYLPNRVNKRQIPKLYKSFGAVEDGDYQFIDFKEQKTLENKNEHLITEWSHDICELLIDHFGKSKNHSELYDLVEEVVRKSLSTGSFQSFKEFLGFHNPDYHQVTHRERYVNEWWPKVLYLLGIAEKYTRDADYVGEDVCDEVIGIMDVAIERRQEVNE